MEERTKNLHIQNKIDIAISSGANQLKHVNSASLDHINDINHLSSPSPSNLQIQDKETRVNEYNVGHDISILTDTTCPPLPPSIQSGNNYNQTILAKPATLQQTLIMTNDEELEIEGTGYDETMTTNPNILQKNDNQRFWE